MFESMFGGNLVSTESVAAEDPNGILMSPSTIIQRNDNWQIRIMWKFTGMGTSTLNVLPNLKYHVRVYYEGLGGGPDGQFPSTIVVPSNPTHDYNQVLLVLSPTNPPAGAYRLVTVINATTGAADTPYDLAGFIEGPYFQLYDV